MAVQTIWHQEQPLFYCIEGSGETIFLLHGFAEDGSIWQSFAQHLIKRYQVIVPDLPGTGASGLTAPLSIDSMADAIIAIADREAISHFTVIGHSMGGYIGLSLLERFAFRINGLLLFHSTAYADSEEKKIARRKAIAFISEYGASPFLQQSIPNLFAPSFQKTNTDCINELLERHYSFNPAALIAYYEAMIERPDRTSVITMAKIPIGFIIGEKDAAVAPADVLQQTYLAELSQVLILPEVAHMGMLEAPAECLSFIDQFLANVYNTYA